MVEIVECEEFGDLAIGINKLLVDGEIALDPRIIERGYLNVSLAKGQVVFRADRYIGLIPLNSKTAVRVRPRAKIANISHMIVRSGVAPSAIPDFSRGYLPRFSIAEDVEKIYFGPLIAGVEKILRKGMMKSYTQMENPPSWRGRLLASNTIKRHRSRNVRYRNEFDYKTLSYGGPENAALKHALKIVRAWLTEYDKRNPAISRADAVLEKLVDVPDVKFGVGGLTHEIGRSVARLPGHYAYYRDPLWTAYLLLQSKIPDLSAEGFVSLDSLIVNLSAVFEAFVRTVLNEQASTAGWSVVDGNVKRFPFFASGNAYHVQPDIMIEKDGKVVSLLDVKYKLELKESDRYELLSFMEAVGVTHGGFILPQHQGSASSFMGRTIGGKELSVLRFDLAAHDIEEEVVRLANNVARMTAGDHAYV